MSATASLYLPIGCCLEKLAFACSWRHQSAIKTNDMMGLFQMHCIPIDGEPRQNHGQK